VAKSSKEANHAHSHVWRGGAVSLDGFLAGIDGSIDWLHFSKDVWQVTTAYWKDVDTILMGRKTYEVAATQRPAKSPNAKSAKRRPHNEAAMRTYVVSRTLKSIDEPATEL
jgi:dihydrofolate reductase